MIIGTSSRYQYVVPTYMYNVMSEVDFAYVLCAGICPSCQILRTVWPSPPFTFLSPTQT
jgi:hypothetical protein